MLEWSGGEFPHKGFSSTYSLPVDGENWAMLPEMKRNIKKSLDMFKSDEIDMAGIKCNLLYYFIRKYIIHFSSYFFLGGGGT